MVKFTLGPIAYRSADYDSFEGLKVSQESDKKKHMIRSIPIYTQRRGSEGSEVFRLDHDPDNGFDLINDREEHEGNCRLATAAWNSYVKNFGENAVEAAEEDILSKVIELLPEILESLKLGRTFDNLSDGEDPATFWDKEINEIEGILRKFSK